MKTQLSSRFDAVIFDCDGTLVDSEPLGLAAIAQEVLALGIDSAYLADLDRMKGQSMAATLATIAQRSGHSLPSDFEATVRARMAASFRTQLQPMPGGIDAAAAAHGPLLRGDQRSACQNGAHPGRHGPVAIAAGTHLQCIRGRCLQTRPGLVPACGTLHRRRARALCRGGRQHVRRASWSGGRDASLRVAFTRALARRHASACAASVIAGGTAGRAVKTCCSSAPRLFPTPLLPDRGWLRCKCQATARHSVGSRPTFLMEPVHVSRQP